MDTRLVEALIVGILALIVLFLILNFTTLIIFGIVAVFMILVYAIYLKYLLKNGKKKQSIPQPTQQQKQVQQTPLRQQIPFRVMLKPVVQRTMTRPQISRPAQQVRPMIPKIEKPSILEKKSGEETLREIAELEKKMRSLKRK